MMEKEERKHIAFIGAGTMARALVDSFDDFSLKKRPVFFLFNPLNNSLNEYIAQKNAYVSKKFDEEWEKLPEGEDKNAQKVLIGQYKEKWILDNMKCTSIFFFLSFLYRSIPCSPHMEKACPLIFLAVKPHDLEQAVRENIIFLFFCLFLRIPIISVMAGVKLETISQLIIKIALENWENDDLGGDFTFSSFFKNFESWGLLYFMYMTKLREDDKKGKLFNNNPSSPMSGEFCDFFKVFLEKKAHLEKTSSKLNTFFGESWSDYLKHFSYKTENCRFSISSYKTEAEKKVLFWENVLQEAKKKDKTLHLSAQNAKFFVLYVFFQSVTGRIMTNLAVEKGQGVGAFCAKDLSQSHKRQWLEKCLKGMNIDDETRDYCFLHGAKNDEEPLAYAWTTDDFNKILQDLTQHMGVFLKVKEEQMDIMTAIAGSAPAFFAVFVESLAQAGVFHGLSHEDALEMAKGALSSTKTLLEKYPNPTDLKNSVSSPRGTTVQGLNSLEKNNFRHIVIQAVDAAVQRAKDLGVSDTK